MHIKDLKLQVYTVIIKFVTFILVYLSNLLYS
jgi:hypothetical protein